MNTILDKCGVVANRMLDAICEALPEWKAASAELREIRSDIVCSLENVEMILKEFIAQGTKPGSSGEINQFILEERNKLKQELQSQSVKEDLINQLYSAVAGYSSFIPTEEKLQYVLSAIQQLLSQLQVSSLQHVFVIHFKFKFECRMSYLECSRRRFHLSKRCRSTSNLHVVF